MGLLGEWIGDDLVAAGPKLTILRTAFATDLDRCFDLKVGLWDRSGRQPRLWL